MIGIVEDLLKSLELPHRLLQCCTGDLGVKNADMIDLESWMPSRGEVGKDGVPSGAYGDSHAGVDRCRRFGAGRCRHMQRWRKCSPSPDQQAEAQAASILPAASAIAPFDKLRVSGEEEAIERPAEGSTSAYLQLGWSPLPLSLSKGPLMP